MIDLIRFNKKHEAHIQYILTVTSEFLKNTYTLFFTVN